jgi:hypothetical protein
VGLPERHVPAAQRVDPLDRRRDRTVRRVEQDALDLPDFFSESRQS